MGLTTPAGIRGRTPGLWTLVLEPETLCVRLSAWTDSGCWRGWSCVLGAASGNNSPARAMSGMGDKYQVPRTPQKQNVLFAHPFPARKLQVTHKSTLPIL